MVCFRHIIVNTQQKGDNRNKIIIIIIISYTRKTFDRFIIKDSYTWNITHNTESVKLEA
jgi:hypothetical protein